VAFSRDGRALVTLGDTVRLWDPATGKQRQEFEMHDWMAHSIALTPDGKTVVTGGSDHAIRLLDLTTGKERRLTPGASRTVYSVAFAPDGKTLVSGGLDGVRIWKIATAEQVRFLDHENVWTIAVSPDGSLVASGGGGARVRLWETATGKECRTIPLEDGEATKSLKFAPGGRTLAAGTHEPAAKGPSTRSAVHLWDVATGKECWKVPGHLTGVSEVAFAPDGNSLAMSGWYGEIPLLDAKSGKRVSVFSYETKQQSPHAIAFSPDGRTFAAAVVGTIRVWELATGKERTRLGGHRDSTTALVFSPDGKFLAEGSCDYGGGGGTVRIWELATGKDRWVLQGHRDAIQSVAFSRDGKLLACASADSTILVWDLARLP
jgi:WD40 repeat protein